MTHPCDGCEGTGRCERCGGTGMVTNYDILMRCTACDGSGICEVCDGSASKPKARQPNAFGA